MPVDLHNLTHLELQELILEIDKALLSSAENLWITRAKTLEEEALEAVEELCRFTGRRYALTLNGYKVTK